MAGDEAGAGAAHHRGGADLLIAQRAEQLAESIEPLLEHVEVTTPRAPGQGVVQFLTSIGMSIGADANAARHDEDHNATLYTIYRTFGDVRSTSEVVTMIEAQVPS